MVTGARAAATTALQAMIGKRGDGLVDESVGALATLDVADAEHLGDFLDARVARIDAADVDGGATVGVVVG